MEYILPAVIVLLAAGVKGVTGFGFALLGTMTLSLIMEPSSAVKLMILPLIASNLELVLEVEKQEMVNCLREFRHFITAGAVSTVAGVAFIDTIPAAVLKTVLGVLTLLFVTDKLAGFESVKRFCFRSSRAFSTVFAIFAGTVFGSTGIAVQVVSYFSYLDISHKQFKSLLAAVILGFSTLRLGALAVSRSGAGLAAGSFVMAFPALIGTYAGLKISHQLPGRLVGKSVLALLAVIGLRLLTAGLGFI